MTLPKVWTGSLLLIASDERNGFLTQSSCADFASVREVGVKILNQVGQVSTENHPPEESRKKFPVHRPFLQHCFLQEANHLVIQV